MLNKATPNAFATWQKKTKIVPNVRTRHAEATVIVSCAQ